MVSEKLFMGNVVVPSKRNKVLFSARYTVLLNNAILLNFLVGKACCQLLKSIKALLVASAVKRPFCVAA